MELFVAADKCTEPSGFAGMLSLNACQKSNELRFELRKLRKSFKEPRGVQIPVADVFKPRIFHFASAQATLTTHLEHDICGSCH